MPAYKRARYLLSILRSLLVGSRMAFVEMRSHKLRSFLSVLGVMLGVASLTAMLTLVGGINVYLNEKMGKWIGTVWFFTQHDPPEEEKIQWARSPGLRFSDGGYLEENAPEAKRFVRSISRHGDLTLPCGRQRGMAWGMDSAALADNFENIYVRRGREFTRTDFERGAKNCLISWELEQRMVREMKLRDSAAVLNYSVIVDGMPVKIAGVYYPVDTTFKPWQLSRAVIMPLRTMQQYISGFDPDPGRLEMMVRDPKLVLEQAEDLSEVLQQRHRGVRDFEYRTADWLENVKRMLSNASLLITIVSVISLVVGGLSIMNVMLSSISERVREIGVRKALGARNLQIFIQFIGETTTLCVSGGIIGVCAGCTPLFFKEAIKVSTQGAIEPTILLPHLIITFCIIVLAGVVFGLYPALKATRLNPIEALQYE
jgi:putative ABC transport system permease protein